VFKRVLPIWKRFRYQLKKNPSLNISIWSMNTNGKLYFKKVEIGGGAVLLLWDIFSPPLALIAKNGDVWEPFYFVLNGTNEYEWRLY
jgi:hypothetical protein